MKNEAPNPEVVGGRYGGEEEIIVAKGVEPGDATDEGVEDKVEDDVGEDDGGDGEGGTLFENYAG